MKLIYHDFKIEKVLHSTVETILPSEFVNVACESIPIFQSLWASGIGFTPKTHSFTVSHISCLNSSLNCSLESAKARKKVKYID
jgi:hypothetical protein